MVQVPPPGFIEEDYLAANPDVAEAVAAGQITSGQAHYVTFGADENRSLRPEPRAVPLQRPFPAGRVPQRRDKILAGLDPSSLKGVEIGPLANPLVTKAEGDVFYVDHTDKESLRQHYRIHTAVNVDNIVEVDGIWGENTLQECIGPGSKVDYVVASHVIEHVPDLITWLAEIRSILRPRGMLRLAIPDRRFTFDYLRFETRAHDVLDAYLRRARTPLPRLIIEHYSLGRGVDSTAAWNGTLDATNLERFGTLRHSLDMARDAMDHGSYHDVHCWVFTPLSFATLCLELAAIDLLELACDYYIDTDRNESEFFVGMIADAPKHAIIESWARMKASLMQRPAPPTDAAAIRLSAYLLDSIAGIG